MAAQRDTVRQVKYRQKHNILYNYKNIIIKAQLGMHESYNFETV